MGVMSDSEIDAWVRANVERAYHPSCTVQMGAANDDLAPLDNTCRVKGVDALRVVDSSVFPSITNGNLNAPTIMVAERAADIIKGSVLPVADVPVWQPEQWQTKQREAAPVSNA